MNDHIKQAGHFTKNFVIRHKTAIAVATTATLCLALNKRNINEMNEFLKEHDLFDEYWATEVA